MIPIGPEVITPGKSGLVANRELLRHLPERVPLSPARRSGDYAVVSRAFFIFPKSGRERSLPGLEVAGFHNRKP
jgi:hypothetical protein